MAPWASWILRSVVVVGGLLGGAGIARATINGIDRREKQQAADAAINKLGAGASLTKLTDVAYAMLWPKCPGKLDPANPAHQSCVRLWLQMQDVVAGRLPPPSISPPAASPLPTTGPAADLRGWLESLTSEQRDNLRENLGAKYYDPIVARAAAGDDAGAVQAVRDLRTHMEAFAEEEPFAALSMLASIKSSLGDKLDVLIQLQQQWKQ